MYSPVSDLLKVNQMSAFNELHENMKRVIEEDKQFYSSKFEAEEDYADMSGVTNEDR